MNNITNDNLKRVEDNISELMEQYTMIQQLSYLAIDKRVNEVYKIRKKTLNTLQLTIGTYKNQFIIGDDK